MVFPRINNPRTTTLNQFGGDVMNAVMSWFAGINIAAVDSTNKPSIDTDTRFRSGRFMLFDADATNELKHVTPQLAESVSLSYPASLTNANLNEFLFAKAIQEIENKTINASKNAITNIMNSNIATNSAIAWTKISKSGSGLGDLANVNLNGLGHNFSIKWDAVTSRFVVYDVEATAGEVNTVSNIGTAGVGVYKRKLNTNFELKKLNPISPVTVTDNVGANQIDIGVGDATTTDRGVVELATSTQTDAGLAVQASDTRLSNARTPLTHANSHKSLGGDMIKVNEFGAPTANITTTNATIQANGTLPILPNNNQMFLNGVGGWSAPIGTASGVSGNGSIMRGVATHTGDGVQKTFTIAHGMSVTPTAYFVEAISVDALGLFTRSVDATNITITYQVAPPAGTTNLRFTWAVFDNGTGSVSGEANTTSSVGSGVSIVKPKVGADLPFRSMFAGSNKISITENVNDVSFDINEANLGFSYPNLTNIPAELVKTNQTNTYGAFLQTYLSDMVKIMNPAETFGYTIAGSAIAANRRATLPLMTADDDFVMRSLAQTLLNKTLTSPTITNPTIAAIASSGFSLAVPSLSANDQIVARNTTDILANKTLTNPTITAIANSGFLFSIPALSANDTAMGRSTTDTIANKSINLATNTVTETAAVAGAIPVHNGTKFTKLDKGADGSFLGVSAGSLGYFVPPTGSGGLLPDGSAIPTTGRWGAMWGGSDDGRGILDWENKTISGSTTYTIISPTENATDITTSSTTNSLAQFRSTPVWSRQSNPMLRAKWRFLTNDIQFVCGFYSGSTLPVSGDPTDLFDNAHGLAVTSAHGTDTTYKVRRNDGSATDSTADTLISNTDGLTHTCEIFLNSTGNPTVKVDNFTTTPTTKIVSLTQPLYIFFMIATKVSGSRGLSIRYIQVTCL